MCVSSGSQKQYVPAAAPAPPLPPADEPNIGQSTLDQNKENFGSTDGPTYRFRNFGTGSGNPHKE